MGRIKIDSAASLRTRLDAGLALEDVVFQGVDLVPFEAKLLPRNLRGCVFLGCRTTSDFAPVFARYGCVVLPRPEGLPFDPFRSKLYSPEELLHRFRKAVPASYHSTPDHLTHLTVVDPETGGPRTASIEEVLLRSLHDDSIREALDEFLGAQLVRGVVAVVGGREASRGSASYRDVALLARDLSRDGLLVVSRGGAGIAEAAHLGAYFAPCSDADLTAALDMLRPPRGQEGKADERAAPFRVRERFPLEEPVRACSVAVASWRDVAAFPCPFATHHAKYFEHSPAGEGLTRIAGRGMVAADLDADALVDLLAYAARGRAPHGGAAELRLDAAPAAPARLVLLDPLPKASAEADQAAAAPPDGVVEDRLARSKRVRGAERERAAARRADFAAAAWSLVESLASDGRVAERLLRTDDPAAARGFLSSEDRAPDSENPASP